MSRTLKIKGEEFQFPEQGTSPSWGNETADWAESVTGVLGTLASDTDILNSSGTLLPNQTNAIILGLLFDVNFVRSAIVDYVAACPDSTDKIEMGTLEIIYNGGSFVVARRSTADVGLTFSIDGIGQVLYSSGPNSGGTLKFRAKTFTQ